jgi:phage terminase small subunit
MAKNSKLKSISVIRKHTINHMKNLGVYKDEYGKIVDIYAELVHQYDVLTQKFEESDFKFEVTTAQGGLKKSPIVSTLEVLRKDILAYSDRLCLNPKAKDAVKVLVPRRSALEIALEKLADS